MDSVHDTNYWGQFMNATVNLRIPQTWSSLATNLKTYIVLISILICTVLSLQLCARMYVYLPFVINLISHCRASFASNCAYVNLNLRLEVHSFPPC